jgi:hypothetical protein
MMLQLKVLDHSQIDFQCVDLEIVTMLVAAHNVYSASYTMHMFHNVVHNVLRRSLCIQYKL